MPVKLKRVFKIGDQVIVVNGRNYAITLKGSIGIVKKYDLNKPSRIGIEFSHVTGDRNEIGYYEISSYDIKLYNEDWDD